MQGVSIGIIGMGWVGSSVAISILHNGLCRQLLLNDCQPGIAEGEAMDLNHGSPFLPPVDVKAATVEEMKSCDIVVITAGRGGKPGETRLQLLNENVTIARELSTKLRGFKGILVIVANPVDVLTYFYQKFSGLPKERVIGTGTLLDTARLRDIIGDTLSVSPKSIHAQVLGEHGDSEMVLWSGANISGVPLKEWSQWSEQLENSIAEKVRKAAYEIIVRKGATNHAIGLVTTNLLKWILRDDQRLVTVSSVIDDLGGYPATAMSLPTLLGRQGIVRYWLPPLTEDESKALKNSARVLRDAIDSVDLD